MNTLTASDAKDMLLRVAERVVASKEALCEADRNIGDGDHGIGMATGLEAARKELESKEFADVYTVFSTVGRTMIRVMGGASGIIFGLLFYAGAKGQPPKPELTPAEFADMFQKALDEIQAKGQAHPGDKTVVDGLAPMAAALQQSAAAGDNFQAMLASAASAAEAGKEDSKQYIAKFGKAKTLGERAVGFPDAGCVTLALIAQTMNEWAQAKAAAAL